MPPQVDEYEAAFNSPIGETVGTRRYVIRQLKGREIGTLNGYLRKVARNPEQEFLDSVGVDSFEELDPDEQRHPQIKVAWSIARRRMRNWKPPTCVTQAGSEILLNTEEGAREFLWVLFSTVHPIPYEDVEEIRLELKVKELMDLFSYAMGMDDSDPKGQREVAVPLPSARSYTVSSREARAESSPPTSETSASGNSA